MKVKVEVQNDHLEKLASARKPVVAITELVWNGLDADAKRVDVTVVRNGLGGIESVRVDDNGHGIQHLEALDVFQKLGSSWKKEKKRSRGEKRLLHGQDGQGRYKAFSLGNSVTWTSRYKENGKVKSVTITAKRPYLTDFEVSDPIDLNSDCTGTTVEVRDLRKQFTSLDDVKVVANELAMRFALYLREYPDVTINFDNKSVDPRQLEERFSEYDLPNVTFEDGAAYEIKLAIIEWNVPVERALYFCDENSFAIEKQAPGIQAPEFTFTAYLRSACIRDLEDRAAFAWEDGHPDLERVIDAARTGMRNHFLARRAEMAQGLIEKWKEEHIYPFEGDPKNPIEKAERQVFNVVAKNVRDYLPSFDDSDVKSKRFSLHLLKRAIETSPGDVQRIIHEVLELPDEKAADLASLLDRTSLAAVIEASKVVADRLDFLRGLEILLYSPESKAQLLERSQLQKILEEHTWIFGEEFALSVADQSLNEVLAKHIKILGREDGSDCIDDVTLPDGRKGIVDLMLSRMIPQSRSEQREHLIVELKRPSVKITKKVLSQTEDYALAVAKDERFRDTETSWHFWAVSNDMDESARDKVSQSERPFGVYFMKDHPKIKVCSMPWSIIIERCRGRLQFYQEKLEYTATDETALAYLHGVHSKYLPDVLKKV